MIYAKELERAVDELGIAGAGICVHASLRSFGDEIEGGPEGIVRIFLEKGCTLMAPAFSYDYIRRAVPAYMPERNGIDYGEAAAVPEDEALIYSPRSKLITADHMGLLSKQILTMEGSRRGNNPINSFTAVGNKAERLMAGQTPEDVYAPFRQLYADDGYVLLMGVGLERATIIHYAEQMAGRTPFIRWANDAEGRIIPVSIGSCSGGFGNFKPLLTEKREVLAGGSLWQCYRARTIVDICKEAIIRNPQITHCGDISCKRCEDAVAGGAIIDFRF